VAVRAAAVNREMPGGALAAPTRAAPHAPLGAAHGPLSRTAHNEASAGPPSGLSSR
jgi:hypothetical protein